MLLLHICEGKSLTGISAFRDSNVMRIQQIFSQAQRLKRSGMRSDGKKYRIRNYLDKTEEEQ